MVDTSFTFLVPSSASPSVEAAAEAGSLRRGLRFQTRWERGRRSSLMILRVKGEVADVAELKADLDRFIAAIPLDPDKPPLPRAVISAISFASGLAGILVVFGLARACG